VFFIGLNKLLENGQFESKLHKLGKFRTPLWDFLVVRLEFSS
jgi:hypothetical protein